MSSSSLGSEDDEDVDTLDEVEACVQLNSTPRWKVVLLEGRERIDDVGARFVLTEASILRKLWEPLITIVLLYTSTVFPYKLCFLDFRIMPEGETAPTVYSLEVISQIVDAIFVIDLILGFFLSSVDPDDPDPVIMRWSSVVCEYLRGTFWINFIACLPPEVFQILLRALITDGQASNTSINETTRLLRLQRISRLIRLTRLVRLLRIVKLLNVLIDSDVVKKAQSNKVVRVFNLITALFWTCHLLACFWYLVASIETETTGGGFTNAANTWVGRRGILGEDDGTVWLHSMYFVLTVFTTVGFGDIHAVTEAEIVYVFVVMMIGAVWHSIIVSEVIATVTVEDEVTIARKKKKELINAYVQHAELDDATLESLMNWVETTDSVVREYDRDEMKKLLTSGAIPRHILGDLPKHLFQGRLTGHWALPDYWPEESTDHRYNPEKHPEWWEAVSPKFRGLRTFQTRMKDKSPDPRRANRFIHACAVTCPAGITPPRFLVLLAMALERQYFSAGEIVYQLHDHPFNIFLVVTGVFAALQTEGGQDAAPHGGPMQSDKGFAFLGDCKELAHKMDRPPDEPSGSSLAKSTSRPQDYLGSLFSKHKAKAHAIDSTSLYPYRFFGCGNYFGDMEILTSLSDNGGDGQEPKAHHRRFTVRCEVSGATLVFNKQGVAKICKEFPHFEQAWRASATRREEKRVAALGRHPPKLSVRNLAACIIQRGFRAATAGTLVAKGPFLARRKREDPTQAMVPIDDEIVPKVSSVQADVVVASGTANSFLADRGSPLTPGGLAAEMRKEVRQMRQELKQAMQDLRMAAER